MYIKYYIRNKTKIEAVVPVLLDCKANRGNEIINGLLVNKSLSLGMTQAKLHSKAGIDFDALKSMILTKDKANMKDEAIVTFTVSNMDLIALSKESFIGTYITRTTDIPISEEKFKLLTQ